MVDLPQLKTYNEYDMKKLRGLKNLTPQKIILLSVLALLVLVSLILAYVFYSKQNYNGTPKLNRFLISKKQRCGLENCHGLELQCGTNIPKSCDLMYQLGDGCREYASCEISDGKCQPKKERRFELCKNCVLECQRKFENEESDKLLECENICIQEARNYL